jgi:hypothetical protein
MPLIACFYLSISFYITFRKGYAKSTYPPLKKVEPNPPLGKVEPNPPLKKVEPNIYSLRRGVENLGSPLRRGVENMGSPLRFSSYLISCYI